MRQNAIWALTLLVLASLIFSNSVREAAPPPSQENSPAKLSVAGLSLDDSIELVESKFGPPFRKETAGPTLELYFHRPPSQTTVVSLSELKVKYVRGFTLHRAGDEILEVGSTRNDVLRKLGNPEYEVAQMGRRDLGYKLESGGTLHLILSHGSVAQFLLSEEEWDSKVVPKLVERAEKNLVSCQDSMRDSFSRLESTSYKGQVSLNTVIDVCMISSGLSCYEAGFRNVAWRGPVAEDNRVPLSSLTLYCRGSHHSILGFPQDHPELATP